MKHDLMKLIGLGGLAERQRVASEIAEMARMQIEALPGERIINIKHLTLNIQVNYASGGGASIVLKP